MKKLNEIFQDSFEDNLRRLCGRMDPTKRIKWIVAILSLLSLVNLYLLISAFYNIGKHNGVIEYLEIVPMEAPSSLPVYPAYPELLLTPNEDEQKDEDE